MNRLLRSLLFLPLGLILIAGTGCFLSDQGTNDGTSNPIGVDVGDDGASTGNTTGDGNNDTNDDTGGTPDDGSNTDDSNDDGNGNHDDNSTDDGEDGADDDGPPLNQDPPPPPPPAAGTVLYNEDFEGSDPFDGWGTRRPDNNVVENESQNRFGRLNYTPHNTTRVSFLPRYEGVFDVRFTFSMRVPEGQGFERGGGKHMFSLSNTNSFFDGARVLDEDGWARLDFAAYEPYRNWKCTNYRKVPGGSHSTTAEGFADVRLEPGRWHQIRVDLHMNQNVGEEGTMELYIDGEHMGGMRGSFNPVGPRAGVRTVGFGNMDHLTGNAWMDVDDIRVEALDPRG